MSFNVALASGDYTNGRSASYAGSQYLSQLPNTVVFAGQVTATTLFAGSFAQNLYGNVTVGAYTDAHVGQLLMISHVNDITQAYFIGRIRLAPDASYLYFNETSIAQTGLDYFWVIDDYPVMDKLIEFNTSSNVYYVDWDVAYHAPRPIIGSANDSVQGKSVYVGYISDATSKFRISVSYAFLPGGSSGTITSWSLSIIDGTLISGSTSGSGSTTGTITIDFPTGFRHMLLSATNSAGQTSTVAIKVWAETRTGSSTLVAGHNGSTITLDVTNDDSNDPGTPQSCTLNMFSTELQSTLNNTPCVVWDDEYLNGTEGSVGSNVRFIGRLRQEDNQTKADLNYLHTLTTRWTLEGPDTQLARLDNFKTFMIQNAVTPANWGDINSMTPYNAIWLLLSEFTTFCNSNLLNFDSYDSTYPYPSLNLQGTTMLAIIQDVASSLDAQMMFSPDGRALIARHAFYLTAIQRNALTTVANWTNADRMADIDFQIDDIHTIAQVDAWGGEWVGGTNVTPLHSMAPGLARDIGEKSITSGPMQKQILANVGATAAQSELNDRAGNHWMKETNQRRLSTTHKPGYAFLIPDVSAWFTWTVDSADNLRGYSFDTGTRWILEKITCTHDNSKGSKTVTPTYRQETNGLGDGNAIAIPDTSSQGVSLPALNGLGSGLNALIPVSALSLSIPPITPPPSAIQKLAKGLNSMALVCSDGTVKSTANFTKTTPGIAPHWVSASLGVSGTVLLWVADPYSPGGDGWIITTTNIYYGTLVTPSFSSVFSFRASSSLRSAAVDYQRSGHIAVVTDYSDGTYATYATTGGNFGAEASLGAGGGTYTPGCFYSQHQTGYIFTSINGTGESSSNSGASFSAESTIVPGTDCATEIYIPYGSNASDSIKYYIQRNSGWTQTFDFTEGQQGWVASVFASQTSAVYVPGVGWQDQLILLTGPDQAYRQVGIEYDSIPSFELTNYTVTATVMLGTGNRTPSMGLAENTQTNYIYTTDTVAGLNTYNSGPRTDSGVTLLATQVGCGQNFGNQNDPGGTVTVSKITVSGTGTNPFTGVSGSDTLIRQSSATSTPLPGPLLPWQSGGQISVSPTSPNIMMLIGRDAGAANFAVYISTDGLTFNPIAGPSSSMPYTRGGLSGDGSNILYLFGLNGAIGYCSDLTTIINKVGDLSTTATVVGISGL